MGQELSTLKVRGIPHSESAFQGDGCLKFLVLRWETFLNYCNILSSVLDKCTLALFTAYLECYCKDNFPIHHLERITHLRSPPLATSSPSSDTSGFSSLPCLFAAAPCPIRHLPCRVTSLPPSSATWGACFCSLPASFSKALCFLRIWL